METEEHKEKLHSSLKLILKSSLIVLIGVFISKLLTLGYRIIVARSFGIDGPEIYGLFSLAMLISSFFVSLFSLGLQEGLLRYIPYYNGKNEESKSNYSINFTLKIHFFTGIIAGIIMYFISDFISLYVFHNPSLSIYLKWFALFVPFSLISATFLILTRAYEKIGWNSFIGNIVQPTIKIIFLLILIFIGFKDSAVIFSYNLGFIIVLIFSFLVLIYKVPNILNKGFISNEDKIKTKKELFNYSWPLMITGLIMFIFYGIDSFIIGYFMNVESVGIYNAAVPIASLLGVAPLLFIQLFFPIISKEFGRKNMGLISDMSKQVGKWIFILNLPLTIMLLIYPEQAITLFFGSEYISAANCLRFLSIGMFFYSIFNVSERLLSMAGKTKAVLFNLLLASIINLILNLILVPLYGINGAGISTMLTYLIWSFISLVQAKHYISIIPLRRKMLAILFSGLIPAFILYLLRNLIPLNKISFAITSILFAIVFFILVFITRSLDSHDLNIINSIKEKIKLPKIV